MKRVLKKLLVIILIFLVLNNFFINSIYANNVNNTNSNNTVTQPNPAKEILEGLLGTVIGLFTWPYRLIATGLAMGFHELMGFLAYAEGKVENGKIEPIGSEHEYTITPFDILFNKIAIVDINFFNFPEETQNPVIYQIREGIATWYYIMRNISVAILLVVLIYVGIRMALATATPEKEAAYKKMLIDWVCSLALVFLLHYIILFTLNVNSALIGGLSQVQDDKLNDAIKELTKLAFLGVSINSLAATVVYCYFVIQTLGLLLSYFSRMLKLAFLVIIAPLITLTYSIDKIGDGKAQALSAWLKEFVYTVLIQPFHCIIYMCFINMSLEMITAGGDNNDIIGAIFAILCMRFTKEAEKILGRIFKFGEYTSESSLNAGLAMAAVAAQKAGGAGKAVRGAVNGAKKIRSAGRNARIGIVAGTKALFGEKRDADGNKTTFSQRKSAAKAEMQANALEKENNRKYKGTGREREIEKRAQQLMAADSTLSKRDARKKAEAQYNASNQAKIDSRAGEIYAQNKDKGMTYAEATARARAEAAKNDRVGARKKKSVISGARGIIRKYQSATNLKAFVKHAIAGGSALFIGASVDGATGNLGTAIGAGIATMKGVKGYFEGSTSNLRDDTQNRLGSMGIAYESDAAEKMNEIMGKGNSGQYNDDAIKDLLNEIEKALVSAGMSTDQAQNTKFNIRNKIERDVKANPDEDLSRIVDRSLSSLGSVGRNTGVIDATSAFANFSQEKNIYENVSSATELGASADSFVSEVLSGYYNADAAAHQPPPEPVIEEEFIERELTDHERDEIIRELQDKYSSLTYTNQYYHAYEYDDSWRQEIEDAQDAIQECIRKLRMNATGGRYTQDLHDDITDIRDQTRKAMSTKNRGS